MGIPVYVFLIETGFLISIPIVLDMNNDNNGPATYRFHSSMSNQGVPISSNPFTSIIRNSRVRSPGPAGRHDESLLRRERQVDENSFQTPQQKQKIRPFQTPNHDKSSTLTPYINLLRGCQANVASVQQSQLRSHEVRRPSLFLYMYS